MARHLQIPVGRICWHCKSLRKESQCPEISARYLFVQNSVVGAINVAFLLYFQALTISSNTMAALGKADFGVTTFYAASHPNDKCGANGLPLTPNSIKVIGRFQFLTTLQHRHLCRYLDIAKSKHGAVNFPASIFVVVVVFKQLYALYTFIS